MNRNIILIGITFLICSFHLSNAQENIQEAIFKSDENWQAFTVKEMTKSQRKNETRNLCINSVTFAKFIVDASGNVSSISFLKDSPSEIKNILKDVIHSTSGKWSPRIVNGKPTESQPFLLPLYFYLNYGCKTNSIENPNKFGQALQNMLKFDDGKSLDQLDCILLPPIEISSVK